MKFSRPRTHKGGPGGVPIGTSRTPTAEDEGLGNFSPPQQRTEYQQALRPPVWTRSKRNQGLDTPDVRTMTRGGLWSVEHYFCPSA